MTSVKNIGMDVHTESISICVRNSIGKIVMECVIVTKASTILQFLDGLRGDLRVVFEEGTWATWLCRWHPPKESTPPLRDPTVETPARGPRARPPARRVMTAPMG